MIKLRAGITRRNLIFRGRDMAGSSAVDMIIWWMIVCGSHLAFIDCACAQITMTTAVSSTEAPMYLWRDNSAFVPHRMSAPDSGISAAWEMGRNYFRPPVSARLSSENMARFFYRIQGPSETFQSMSWFSGGGTKTVGVRGPGVFTWYHTRIGSMNFNFRGPFGGTPGTAKSKIKIRAHFVVLPKNPQHNNILNIAWTLEQLNLKFNFFWMGAQKFMGAQKLLRGHDASASLRHPQLARDRICCMPSPSVCNCYTRHDETVLSRRVGRCCVIISFFSRTMQISQNDSSHSESLFITCIIRKFTYLRDNDTFLRNLRRIVWTSIVSCLLFAGRRPQCFHLS